MIKIEIDMRGLRAFEKRVQKIASGAWQKPVHHGLIDAGRRTGTKVMRSAQEQMAAKSYGFVRNRTRQQSSDLMQYRIFSSAGGARIEEYKGLRSVKSGRLAEGQGGVASAIWNSPRTFKRSFAANGGYFATLPGSQKVAPKVLWTYGPKPDQPRGPGGLFSESNRTYGPVRRLFGPALSKELTVDESLATFQRVAPAMLVEKVVPRLEKLLNF